MSFFKKFSVPLLSKLGLYQLGYLAYSKVVISTAVLLRPKLRRFLCLDIGCSSGAFTRMLSGICDEVIGMDINFHSKWTKNDQAGVDFVVADASRIPIRSRSVNLVVAFHCWSMYQCGAELLNLFHKY
jgi:SAM-dependent methyltransferase